MKASLSREYNVKDPRKIKTIIRWQITKDPVIQTIKINQSAFIRDLVMEESLDNCNANIVPMKARFSIDMSDADAYKEEDLHTFQQLIEKLIYLACGTRPDIAFTVRQFSRQNADPRKGHL